MSAKYVLVTTIAVAALSLAACGQSHAPSTTEAAAADRAPVATPAQPQEPSATSAAVGSATLTVTPDVVDNCKPGQPVAATVKWHSDAPKVKVMVAGPGQATPHLFSESGFTGSAQTGNWVFANTRFTLIDAVTNRQLAQVVVAPKACASK